MTSSKPMHPHWLVFAMTFSWLLSACGGGDSSNSNPPVAVPTVTGMTQAAATAAITGAKLTLGTVTMAASSTVASGSVISESPAAGTSVASGSAVNLTVSSGPAPVAVPNVVGSTQATATTTITGAGLTLGTVTMAASSTVASGSVISESPAAGTSVASGSAVNLTVSSGAGAAQHFAYVSNAGDGTISAYSVDGTTGALTPLAGSPIAVAGAIQLYEAKVDPSGKFLYVVDNSATGPMDIYAFSIDAGTGALTAVAGSPFAGGNQPQSLAFDASGAYLYVANVTDNSISAYSISSTTGVLTQLSGSPFTVSGTNPAPEQIVRAGNYLYTVNSNTNAVDVFAINTGTGALTEGVAGSPFATDTGPFSLVVDPSGAVLYTANVGASSNGSISAFTINSSTGVLSAVAGNPLAIQVSNYLAIDPHSKFLFVTLITGGVAAYPINAASGVLGTAAAGSPFATGTNSYSVTVDPSGQFVYVCNDGSANVSEFSLAAGTGVLTPIAGSPVSAGANPDFIAIN